MGRFDARFDRSPGQRDQRPDEGNASADRPARAERPLFRQARAATTAAWLLAVLAYPSVPGAHAQPQVPASQPAATTQPAATGLRRLTLEEVQLRLQQARALHADRQRTTPACATPRRSPGASDCPCLSRPG